MQRAVSLQVSDGQGGVAIQDFIITVLENPENSAPIFTSSPPTTLNLPGSTNPASGMVDPTSITVELTTGEPFQTSVSITLPDDEVEAFADVVFIVDEQSNMREQPSEGDTPQTSRQGWVGEAALRIDAAYRPRGLVPIVLP